MKQRITYVVKDPDSFSPEQLSVPAKYEGQAFTIRDVHAAKEHRLTAGLDDLPKELRNVFQQWHEIHIRWVSPKAYTATPPFTSRVSPGLHVFFTPFESTPEDALCKGLRTVVGEDVKCTTTNESAIKMPMLSERFAMGTTSQYYAYVDSIEGIITTFRKKYCRLKDYSYERLADELKTAEYVDIDYDTISGAVVLTGGWSDAPHEEGWSETIQFLRHDSKVEIGVLSHETNPDPEDIQFGGFLTVLRQDDAPKPARFQTPTRHYPLLHPPPSASAPPKLHPLTYTTSLSHPTGLHPTLLLSFPKQHLTPPDPTCKLHTHLTLPSTLFIDKYQFTDALTLRSKNIKSLRSLAGATDLEAPDWVVSQWGSAALFELAHPSSSSTNANANAKTDSEATWTISIPLHLRYLPAAPSSHTLTPLPWPVVFWACRADEGAKMAANPFDRTHLGYEALFGPKTRFMHVEPEVRNGSLVEWIAVPVLDTRRSGWVEAGTVGTVVVAFLGLCWVLFGRGVGKGEKEVKGTDGGKKKQ